MLPLVFHFIYLLIFSQISSFSTENVLAKTFLQHVFKFHPHNACDQIICCSQPVAVGPSPSPASAPSVAPRLSVAGIFGLTCGMTMPRETNHSHNFKTISNCATSSASFSCSPSVRIPSIYSSASSPLTFQPFLGFWVFGFLFFWLLRVERHGANTNVALRFRRSWNARQATGGCRAGIAALRTEMGGIQYGKWYYG